MTDRRLTTSEAMAAQLQRQIEAQFYDALGVAGTTTKWEEQPAFTVERLQEVLDALPPKETWVVSRMFPPDGAIIAKTPGENFTCINDATWERLRIELRRSTPVEHLGNPFCEIRPFFIDADAHDDLGHAAWRAKERKRILDRIAGVITAHVELKRIVEASWRRL